MKKNNFGQDGTNTAKYHQAKDAKHGFCDIDMQRLQNYGKTYCSRVLLNGYYYYHI